MSTNGIQLKLKESFSTPEWDHFFADYAKMSGIDLSLRDNDGVMVSAYPAKGEKIRCDSTEKNHCDCERIIKEATEKASAWDKSSIFWCGPLYFSICPILINHQTLGSISCGPVMMWGLEESDKENFIAIKSVRNCACENSDDLRHVNYETLRLMGETLFSIVKNILKQQNVIQYQRTKITKLQEKIAEITPHSFLDNTGKGSPLKGPVVYSLSETNRGLVEIIKSGDSIRAVEKMNEMLMQIFASSGGNLDIIKTNIHGLIAVLIYAAISSGVTLDNLRSIIKKDGILLAEETQYDEACIITAEVMDEINTLVHKAILGQKTNKHLKNALHWIQCHYDSDLSLERVAEEAYISPYYLSHLFQTEIKTTFNDYVQKTRMEAAVQLMKEEKIPISEIARRTGYRDAGYFSKSFKKYYQVTPRKYMEDL